MIPAKISTEIEPVCLELVYIYIYIYISLYYINYIYIMFVGKCK